MKRRTKMKIDIPAPESDESLAPDFKQETMIMQLRKIVDSIGNPSPIWHVRTDNGRTIWVAHKHAKTIVDLYDRLTAREAKSSYVDNRIDAAVNSTMFRAKQQLIQSLQTTDGLLTLLKELRYADR